MSKNGYFLLPLQSPPSDSSLEEDTESLSDIFPQQRWRHRFTTTTSIALTILASLALLGIGAFGGRWSYHLTNHHNSRYRCENPTVRREWRTLSIEEKAAYIDAVSCTRRLPSKIGMQQALFDDFPYVHSRIGNYSHETAAFLAWHRYFIHVYEQTLQTDCGYQGYLPYWNWELDWSQFAASPIWDPVTGFGGDGDPDGVETVGKGRCVIDGPFADVVALYYDVDHSPHCLSRGFNDGQEMWDLCLSQITPDALEALLRRDNYNKFNLGLEHGPHFALPFGVQGDFHNFTAPYDPIFFLHHAQLDRLWWMWQQVKPDTRRWEYNGVAGDDPSRPAALSDPLFLGGLAPDAQAKDIMDTESGLLCYRY